MLASAMAAEPLLRNTDHFQWIILPVFLLVLYVLNEQMANRRWGVLFGALGLWLMDWINEIINGLIAHFSGYAPIWGTPNGHSSLLLLIGLNIEISLMFAIMGVIACRMLPVDRTQRWLGLGNRWWLALINSLLCVLVECWLNHIGVLVWAWRGWQSDAPWLIFLLGYLPFFLLAFHIHDLPTNRARLKWLASLALVVVLALLIFSKGLAWI